MRFLLVACAAATLLAACSSSSSSPQEKEPEPTPPVWVDAPAAPVDLYEGRTTEIPVTVRAQDPASVRLVVADIDGLTSETIVSTDAPSAPSSPDLYQAKLVLRVGYRFTGLESLHVDVIAGSLTTPVTLPAKSHRLAWKPHTWKAGGGPQTREHGVFAIDPDARAAFLLQGSGYSPQWKPIEDSWRFDLATGTWSAWTPSGDAMSARAGHRIARVPGKKVAYVQGGYTGFEDTETTVGDLYRIDFDRPDHVLTKIATANAAEAGDAPVRNLHAMAYDAEGDQLVVFGGATSTPSQLFFNDTWLVKMTTGGDSATWTKLTTAKSPSARYGAFYALDEPSRRFVVWSGGQYPTSNKDTVNAAADAWALDLSATPPAWSKLAPAGEAPPGRRNGCVMHDPIGRRLFVFGGTSDGSTTRDGLWVLGLEPGHEAWTKLDLTGTPHARSSGFGFATPEGGVACGFGNDDALYSDVNVLGYFD